MVRSVLIFLLSISLFFNAYSQVINAYAKLTSQAGDDFTVSIDNQAFHSFVVGEYAVIMQVQDDIIGTNTNNNNSFGDISNIENAGYYEIREITSINGNTTPGFSTGAISQISLNETNGSYNFGTNSSVQLISFRQMSTDNYTSVSDISALDWDGDIGGVIALEVPGVFTLNHNISADESGFRGGLRSNNYGGPICSPANSDRFRENNNQLGFKGEGIYRNTTNLYNNGRAKLTNGGGGGSHHNGGGAGGGNFTTGGIGGNGYNDCNANPAGGTGGLELSPYITVNRIFMGGGGGGGQQNNSQSRDGGNGGGVVLIKADEITTDACSGVSISANGTGPLTSGSNDGGGGGGAGGSIVFDINNWNISSGCPLNVSSNGGDGSSSLTGQPHAGGGAGAQGVIIYNTIPPSSNVNSETINGEPGCGNNSNPCNSLSGSASGADNSGIINLGSPLPIELIHFDVEHDSKYRALIKWTTESEQNNDYFTVERSSNGKEWKTLANVDGAGNSNSINTYKLYDEKPLLGNSYYRLKQTDYNGKFEYSSIRSLNISDEGSIKVYPNPFDSKLTLSKNKIKLEEIEVFNILGQNVTNLLIVSSSNQNEIQLNTSALEKGSYILRVNSESLKIVK